MRSPRRLLWAVQEPLDSNLHERRAELARGQAAIVRALQVGTDLPPGFQLSQVVTAAESLARKRCRSVQKSWPKLAAGLGDRFETHFRTFASETPQPAEGSAADGYHFTSRLKSGNLLPESARVERATWQVSRGFPLRFVFLPNARQLVVVCRVGGTVRAIRFGMSRRQ
jgi:hypothetical protein